MCRIRFLNNPIETFKPNLHSATMTELNQTSTNPTSTCPRPDWADEPLQVELSNILRGLKKDPNWVAGRQLGTDGVMRTLTRDGDVVDAVGLTPDQIRTFLRRMPKGTFRDHPPREGARPALIAKWEKVKDQLVCDRALFEGADGTKVPREQWFNPDRDILPGFSRADESDKKEEVGNDTERVS